MREFKKFSYDKMRIDILHSYDPVQNKFYMNSKQLYFDVNVDNIKDFPLKLIFVTNLCLLSRNFTSSS